MVDYGLLYRSSIRDFGTRLCVFHLHPYTQLLGKNISNQKLTNPMHSVYPCLTVLRTSLMSFEARVQFCGSVGRCAALGQPLGLCAIWRLHEVL